MTKWTRATLITVAKHRNSNGELEFSEETVERTWILPSGYERIWEQNTQTEAYQRRIHKLLSEGNVVLKVVG